MVYKTCMHLVERYVYSRGQIRPINRLKLSIKENGFRVAMLRPNAATEVLELVVPLAITSVGLDGFVCAIVFALELSGVLLISYLRQPRCLQLFGL